MNQILEDLLYERWPELYRGRSEPITQNLMAFGFECEAGWYDLLDALSGVLTEHADACGRGSPKVTQVKEKYGTLRYYVWATDEFDDGSIAMAEELSGRICEVSGAPGRLHRRGGWYRTLSPQVALESGYPPIEVDKTEPMAPVPGEAAARILRERWPLVIVGDVDIPAGWVDIVDALASRLSRRGYLSSRPPVPIQQVRMMEGRLVVEVERSDQSAKGAIAMAVAMAGRTDRETGCSSPPRLPDEEPR